MRIGKSIIVLGGHSLLKLNDKSCSDLLLFALNNGIDEIDSAPSYPNLEKLLGNISFIASSYKINSKVGIPNQKSFKKGQIIKEIETSLKTLRIDKFENIFVHSVPYFQLHDFVFEELQQIKLSGITNKIGYSSNSNKVDLASAVDSNFFDSFQITLNILDQSNLAAASKIHNKQIYWKRVFGSGVLQEQYLNKIKLYVKSSMKLKRRYDENDYLFRYLKFFGIAPHQKELYALFQNFVMQQIQNSKIIIGTTRISHLNQALECERNKSLSESRDNFQLSRKFSTLEKEYCWTPRD